MNDRTSWLNERRKGIGGSDIGAILGLSPYRTPVDVWMISEMLLHELAVTGSITEAFDRVMGNGAYDKLASDLYDALREASA